MSTATVRQNRRQSILERCTEGRKRRVCGFRIPGFQVEKNIHVFRRPGCACKETA
jgi:hypothetical protein